MAFLHIQMGAKNDLVQFILTANISLINVTLLPREAIQLYEPVTTD